MRGSVGNYTQFSWVGTVRTMGFFQDVDQLYFLPLGGVNQVGMNCSLYGINGKWLMVDLGVAFSHTPGIDIIVPDLQGISPYANDIVGIVLTHAHEDHYGAIPYLWNELKCPVYATPFASAFLHRKLHEHKLRVPVHTVALGDRVELKPFSVQFIPVTHSIPEPCALAIKTKAGTVVHTGDWKLDPKPLVGQVTDEKTLIQLGDEGVLALMCDSTNIFEEDPSLSEADVRETLDVLIGQHPENRIVVGCFASNVARVKTCVAIARKHGRSVGVVGTSLKRTAEAAHRCGYFDEIENLLPEEEINRLAPSRSLIIATGNQGEPRSALVRMAEGTHPVIRLTPQDVVLFSSKIIPGNESVVFALESTLRSRGVQVITRREAEGIHASGHPGRDELRKMYAWIRPKVLVPVHGEPRHLYEHAFFARENGIPNVIVPENGDILRISGEKPERVGKAPHGKLAIDGKRLIDYAGHLIKERSHMMGHGVISVVVTASRAVGKVIDYQVKSLGVCQTPEESDALSRAILKELKSVLDGNVRPASEEDFVKEVRHFVRRQTNAILGKKPSSLVQIVWM